MLIMNHKKIDIEKYKMAMGSPQFSIYSYRVELGDCFRCKQLYGDDNFAEEVIFSRNTQHSTIGTQFSSLTSAFSVNFS